VTESVKNPFRQWIRLEQPRLGTRVVFATDDFFAAKERLIEPAAPVFVDGKYDDHGKWMDGWESRRKREPGHDYCVVRLGVPGVVRGIEIDTRFFTGNFPPVASIDACASREDHPQDEDGWWELLPPKDLAGDARAFVPVDCDRVITHLRLNIFPDGGIARLRIYGEVTPDWDGRDRKELLDLLSLENGGRAIICSDEHYGSMHNLNVAGRGVNMGDGWETARRRGPGNDWVVLALGHPGRIEKVLLDTAHFKGNYPARASLQGGVCDRPMAADIEEASRSWPVLLPDAVLGPDQQHVFAQQLADVGVVSHLRLSIYPDGGISRLRAYGYLE